MESEAQKLRESMVKVAVDHFELLAEMADATEQVHQLGTVGCSTALQLQDALEKAYGEAKALIGHGDMWNKNVQRCRRAVTTHFVGLQQLLEAPVLVEEAIRQELYPEALEIVQHVQRSTSGCGVEIQVPVEQRAADAAFSPKAGNERGRRLTTLAQLRYSTEQALEDSLYKIVLPSLSSDLTVDRAFRLIQFLRLVLTEASTDALVELFLCARSSYIDALMEQAKHSTSSCQRVQNYLQVYRGPMNEVILQYMACFGVRTSSTSTEGNSVGTGRARDLLAEWCHRQGEVLLGAIAADIGGLSNSYALSLVWDQGRAACLSTSKTQFSIWPRLSSLVVNRVAALFTGHIEEAKSVYRHHIQHYSWRGSKRPGFTRSIMNAVSGVPSTSASQALTGVMPSSNLSFSGSLLPGEAAGVSDLVPPSELIHFTPLAHCLNAFLQAANSIRALILPGMGASCTGCVSELLQWIGQDLARNGGVWGSGEGSAEAFAAAVHAFKSLFCPYVQQCVAQLFGEEACQQIAKELLPIMNRLSTFEKPPILTANVAPLPTPAAQTEAQEMLPSTEGVSIGTV